MILTVSIDVLFLPEGWYHAVESEAGTLAANIWFQGMRKELVRPDHRATSYYARCVIKELQDRELEKSRKEGREIATQVLLHSNSITHEQKHRLLIQHDIPALLRS